jgi:type IV pilus assembly protein PilV
MSQPVQHQGIEHQGIEQQGIEHRAVKQRALRRAAGQGGFFLIEALIALLIFSLGILGMVGMGGAAIAAQSDAQYRTEAANFANEIATQIALNVDRANLATSLLEFAHQPVDGGYCNFGGSASTQAVVANWVASVSAAGSGLPGANALSQQIQVDVSAGGHNKLTITVCWQPPSSSAIALAPMRRHTLISYVN